MANVPASQDMHALAPEIDWKDPAAQLEHELAPAAEYAPDAHKPDAADSPVAEQYLPARQFVQLDWPLLA